jgi:flagellar FliJ protein
VKRQFALATVLRVRRIEEDLAKAQVARMRVDATRAEQLVADRAERLDTSAPPAAASALAYVAALEGLHGQVRGLAAAKDARAASYAAVDGALTAWSGARTRVRGIERLEERHGSALRAADESAAGAERDDRAGAAHFRRTTTARSAPGARATDRAGGAA